jgi:hypothetical protein
LARAMNHKQIKYDLHGKRQQNIQQVQATQLE